MFRVLGAAAVALLGSASLAAASPIVIASGSYAASNEQEMFRIEYTLPPAGAKQMFEFRYSGRALDGGAVHTVQYNNLRILPNGANDSWQPMIQCAIFTGPPSQCGGIFAPSWQYPSAEFHQTASPGLVRFTFTNPNMVFSPDCNDANSCVQTWGFDSGVGDIVGAFGPGEAGAYQLLAYDMTAVPEPATWALMIVGFGLVGSAARRTRSFAAA